MTVLIVAATPFEIAPLIQWLNKNLEGHPQTASNGVAAYTHPSKPLEVRVLVTGVGMTATAFHLGQFLTRNKPDWVVNIGIAGAFDRSIALGAVVEVVSDTFADLGVEEADGRFTGLFDLGLAGPDEFPFKNGVLQNPFARDFDFLPKAKGLTVNKVHGFEPSIQAFNNQYPDATIETMEGAAFFYACLHAGVRFTALRGISNYVETRNREAWDLPASINGVNEVMKEMLSVIIGR